MTLFERVHLPSFAGATEWLNTEPLGPAALEGHLRPKPRRPTDLLGFNSTWWMALGWPLLIVVALFPFPWWW